MKIEFEVPSSEAPGYLKRMRKLAAFMEMDGNSAERWDLMIEYLLDYVTKPANEDKAREALWDMSESEYNEMLERLTAQGDVPKNK
jgi:hypothetical protein